MAPNYSTVQKLSLAGMVIGAMLCTVGAIAPYWLVSDVQGGSSVMHFFNGILNKVVKANMGIFIYCVEFLHESSCDVLPMSTDSSDGWYIVARGSAVLCVMGSGLTGFIALCLACCRCCDRFICLGILSFLSACPGALSLILFDRNMSVFTTSIMDYKIASYGWAFYVFCVGVAIMGLVAFTACFSAPESNGVLVGPVLSNQPTAVVMSNVSQTSPYVPLPNQGPMNAGLNQYPMTNPATSMPGVVTSDGYGY